MLQTEGMHNAYDSTVNYVSRKAKSGFGMGLAGVLTGGLALLSNAGGNGNGGLFGGLFGGENCSTQCQAGPTTWEVYQKECQDSLDLTKYILNAKYDLREQDSQEKFMLNQKIDNVSARVLVLENAKPYEAEIRHLQDTIIKKDIAESQAHTINYINRLDCWNIKGEKILPNTPIVTGLASYNSPGCNCNCGVAA